ncbi:MAG: WecB/TagA/CpsF family glycosyltransferase, partial [Planctomycetota bacterium]
VNADLSLADGAPVVWLARQLGMPLKERVAGSDLFDLLRKSDPTLSPPIRVFFFGGREGSAQAAHDKLVEEQGRLVSVGWHNPGFGDVDSMTREDIRAKINAAKPDFIIVSLGAAKGQAWIEQNQAKLDEVYDGAKMRNHRRQLAAGGLGERVHRELGRAVHRAERRDVPTDGRAEQNDVARASEPCLRFCRIGLAGTRELLGRGPEQPRRAQQVGADHFFPLRLVGRQHRAVEASARVDDEQVGLGIEMVDRPVQHLVDHPRLGAVAGDAHRGLDALLGVEFAFEGIDRVRTAGVEHELGTVGREPPGDGGTDPCRRARDDRDPALERAAIVRRWR